jgi:hypothetical protein
MPHSPHSSTSRTLKVKRIYSQMAISSGMTSRTLTPILSITCQNPSLTVEEGFSRCSRIGG